MTDLITPTPEVESADEAAAPPRIRLSKKKKLLFSAVVFAVFLVLLEGSLRLLGVKPPDAALPSGIGLYRASTNSIGFEYTPGWDGVHAGARVHINSYGWRGKEFAREKPLGTFRIIGVGDSFTFGKAVDDQDVFLAKLETMLNADGGENFEALNAGHEGINTVDELRYFNERETLQLSPDAVVLGFTVSNDAEETPNRRAYRQRKRTASLPLRITESDLFRTLAQKSRLAALLSHGAEWVSTKRLSKINSEIILSNYEEGSHSWERCRDALLGFYATCRQHQVPFVLVLFPDCSSSMDEAFKDYPAEFIAVHARIKAVFSGKSGATVVDILDDLAPTSLTARQTMVPIDGHPNALWHEIVARRLSQVIRDLIRDRL